MMLAERYALVEAGSGALLLDLVSGNLLELNESGRYIWQLAIAGSSQEAIAATLVDRHALDPATALGHVRQAMNLSLSNIPEQPPTVFNYERRGAEYVFQFEGESTFVVDDRGERMALAARPEGASLEYLLQAIAPKILSLRGHAVLHAAAVALGDHVVAFSGYSRAGKTTTARAFVSAGATFICQDKLLVKVDETQTRTARFSERAIAAWVAETAQKLRTSKATSCSGLDAATSGETLPLVEIGFLDAQRRTPGPYAAMVLAETETAGAVFRNGFYGSDESKEWIRHLRTAAQVSQSVRGYDLTMPEGLDRLADAVTALIRAGSLAG